MLRAKSVLGMAGGLLMASMSSYLIDIVGNIQADPRGSQEKDHAYGFLVGGSHTVIRVVALCRFCSPSCRRAVRRARHAGCVVRQHGTDLLHTRQEHSIARARLHSGRWAVLLERPERSLARHSDLPPHPPHVRGHAV